MTLEETEIMQETEDNFKGKFLSVFQRDLKTYNIHETCTKKEHPRKICRKVKEIFKKTNWKKQRDNVRYIYFLRCVGVSTQKLQYSMYIFFKKKMTKTLSISKFHQDAPRHKYFLIHYERPLAGLPIWKHVKNE